VIRFGDFTICSRTKTITRGGVAIVTGGRRRGSAGEPTVRRFEFLKHLLLAAPRGLTADEVFDRVYGHEADGGPDAGPHVLPIVLCLWRQRGFLRRAHLRVVKERRVSRIYYSVVPADVV